MKSQGLSHLCLVFVINLVKAANKIEGTATNGQLQEFCQNEIFRATCGPNDVIVMDEARYGRMHQSRCVRKDYGFIGCQKDVLDIADVICSGRHTCSIRVPNEMLDTAKTECPEDFKSYFEAKHSCVQVAAPRSGACRNENQVVLTDQKGTIANIVTSETHCGSAHAPWVIQVKPGQRINVTLMDFAYGSLDNLADHTKCYAYASIKEIDSKRSATVCGGRSRTTHVYTSTENKIRIVIFGSGTDNNARHYLLKYEAIGCADPVNLKNGWFKRTGDKLELGCDDSSQTHIVTCNGTHWDRDITNCSVIAASKAGSNNPFGFAMSYDIAIVIILAIALVIASFILCGGIICMRRIRSEHSQNIQQRLYSDRSQYLAQNVRNDSRKEFYPACQASYEQYRTGENVYASIQENLPPHTCTNECKQHNSEICTCRHEISREMPSPRDQRIHTGSGPYSSLEQPFPGSGPEPISPTSRSECSSIYPETGRPYYVLDPRDEQHE